jgi:hypothetical protein
MLAVILFGVLAGFSILWAIRGVKGAGKKFGEG